MRREKRRMSIRKVWRKMKAPFLYAAAEGLFLTLMQPRLPLKGVPEPQRGRGMSATVPGCFEAETSQAAGTSPCARLHLRLPVAVPLRRGNCAMLVAIVINSPVASQRET